MIFGVVKSSILQEKSKKISVRGAKNTTGATMKVFKETLKDLEEYLDTNNLRKLSEKSLTIILDDILEIIKGLRKITPSTALEFTTTLDGMLEKLRDARDSIQHAIDLLNKGKRNDFYKKLRESRASLEIAIKYFKN